jgi:hypothetical protein
MSLVAKISRSDRKTKRYKATIYQNDQKLKTIHFGSSDHQNYTMHKDPKRKALYLQRHVKDPSNNPLQPSFYATNLLWNKPTLKSSIKDIKKTKGISIIMK